MAAGSIISSIAQDADKDVGLTAITNYLSNMSEKEKAKALTDKTSDQYNQLLSLLNEYNSKTITPDSSVVSEYYNALSGYTPEVIDSSATDFNFNSRSR
jgi:hypothetical protein